MNHYTVTFKPDGPTISIHAQATILEAAAQAGIILNSACGGQGTCGKCKVILEPAGREVLACQYKIETDLTVTIPPESRFFEPRILQHGIDRQITVAPKIRERLGDLADTKAGFFGVALDIGTTTIVAELIDLADGNCKATAAGANPQIACGDDVISRISYAGTEAGLDKLHDAVIECVNSLINHLCAEARITSSAIYEVVAVGNTTMNHLFLRLPVTQLGRAPYKAFSTAAHDREPEAMSININTAGNIHTVENIAGFVGSDTVAAALAVGIDTADKMTLVVDIGTNGEIVLGTKDKMYAASCAAGPAFEGARISRGSRAVKGAIERVIITDGDIDLDVIGRDSPRSICGSGLIDAVAVLLDLGIVDGSGRFVEPEQLKGKLPEAIRARVIRQDRQGAFVLAHNEDNDNEPVILTQRDIRETQLAKAAIRAGIAILQRKFTIKDNEIEQILLAGAFGNYIRPESAVRIGLLPDVGVQRIHFVGNAAAVGAQMVLISTEAGTLAGRLAEEIEYIETAHAADFQTIFVESILFNS